MDAHARSKAHRRNVERARRASKTMRDETEWIYPARKGEEGVVSDGEAETHAERLARLRAQKILKAGEKESRGKFSLEQFEDSDEDGDDRKGSESDDSDIVTKRATKKLLVKELESKREKDATKRSRRHAQSKRLKSATKTKKSKPGKRQRLAMKITAGNDK